jgi:hypothetical protein
MSKAYAWRPLAILPILKGSVFTDTGEEWLQHRHLEVYHRSMDHIIEDINHLCSRDIYLRFADDRVRCVRTFFYVLVMDGAEVAAALLCDVNQSERKKAARNDSISCDLGLRYPLLQSIFAGHKNHQTLHVSQYHT